MSCAASNSAPTTTWSSPSTPWNWLPASNASCKTFLLALVGFSLSNPRAARMDRPGGLSYIHYNGSTVSGKTFYIETFGCQMNAHDSEKVVGTLLSEGYAQVAAPEDARLVLYNTCSIRDKAEQKVFSRLQNFKREGMKDKIFGVQIG